ncbi:radical SAM protein [bacterium]|nr:radical SAM protein [bacterium]
MKTGKRILLANPPWSKKGHFAVRAGSRWPHFEKEGVDYQPFPFFLAIATSMLRAKGYEARVIDALAQRENVDSFVARVADFKPDLLFFEISTPSLLNDIEVARSAMQALDKPVPCIFGGLHKPALPEELFDQFPDLAVFINGEYEQTLLEVIEALSNEGSGLDRIAGISYRSEAGHVVTTAAKTTLETLDELPWPAYEQLPLYAYHDACGGLARPSVQLWASRGCPFGCIFCAWPQIIYGGRNYRTRNPVRVVDELEWLIGKYGFRSAYFDDDTFNIGPERIRTLAREIGKRGLSVEWGIMARADTMDRETLEIMVANGLKGIKYGVESGNQSILNNCGKKLAIGRVRETVNWTRDLGLKYHLSFAFGLPGETKETIKQTVDCALELDPTSIQFSLITPFPGSDYYHSLKASGHLTSEDWSRYDGYTSSVIRTDSLDSRDLEQALHYAESRWRRHLARRLLRQPGLHLVKRAIQNPRQVLNLLSSLTGRY